MRFTSRRSNKEKKQVAERSRALAESSRSREDSTRAGSTSHCTNGGVDLSAPPTSSGAAVPGEMHVPSISPPSPGEFHGFSSPGGSTQSYSPYRQHQSLPDSGSEDSDSDGAGGSSSSSSLSSSEDSDGDSKDSSSSQSPDHRVSRASVSRRASPSPPRLRPLTRSRGRDPVRGGGRRAGVRTRRSPALVPKSPSDTGHRPSAGHRTPDTGHQTLDAVKDRAPDDGYRTPDAGHQTLDAVKDRVPDDGYRTSDVGHRTPESGRREISGTRNWTPDSGHRTPAFGRTPDTGHRTPDAVENRAPDTDLRTPDAVHRVPDTGHRSADTGHRTPDTGLQPDTGHRSPDIVRTPDFVRTPDTGHRTLSGHRSPDTVHRTSKSGHRTQDTGHRPMAGHRTPVMDGQTSDTGLCPDTEHHSSDSGRRTSKSQDLLPDTGLRTSSENRTRGEESRSLDNGHRPKSGHRSSSSDHRSRASAGHSSSNPAPNRSPTNTHRRYSADTGRTRSRDERQYARLTRLDSSDPLSLDNPRGFGVGDPSQTPLDYSDREGSRVRSRSPRSTDRDRRSRSRASDWGSSSLSAANPRRLGSSQTAPNPGTYWGDPSEWQRQFMPVQRGFSPQGLPLPFMQGWPFCFPMGPTHPNMAGGVGPQFGQSESKRDKRRHRHDRSRSPFHAPDVLPSSSANRSIRKSHKRKKSKSRRHRSPSPSKTSVSGQPPSDLQKAESSTHLEIRSRSPSPSRSPQRETRSRDDTGKTRSPEVNPSSEDNHSSNDEGSGNELAGHHQQKDDLELHAPANDPIYLDLGNTPPPPKQSSQPGVTNPTNLPQEGEDKREAQTSSLNGLFQIILDTLPEDICPHPPAPPTDLPASAMELLARQIEPDKVTTGGKQLLKLPTSQMVVRALQKFDYSSSSATANSWSVSAADQRAAEPPASYRPPCTDASSGLDLGQIPHLDRDFDKTEARKPQGQVNLPLSCLETWELRERKSLGLISQLDFLSSAILKLISDHFKDGIPDSLRDLLLAVGKTNNAMAVNTAASTAEFIRLRREQHLAVIPEVSLKRQGFDELRATPLTSSSLFGSRIDQVLERDSGRQMHALLVATTQKASSAKRSASAPSFQKEAKKQKVTPTSSSGAPPKKKYKKKKSDKFKGKKSGKAPFKPSFSKGPGPKGKP